MSLLCTLTLSPTLSVQRRKIFTSSYTELCRQGENVLHKQFVEMLTFGSLKYKTPCATAEKLSTCCCLQHCWNHGQALDQNWKTLVFRELKNLLTLQWRICRDSQQCLGQMSLKVELCPDLLCQLPQRAISLHAWTVEYLDPPTVPCVPRPPCCYSCHADLAQKLHLNS